MCDGRTEKWTHEGDSKGPSTDGGETKNQTNPMNQSEEKSKKPHFWPFLRGLAVE